MVDRPTQVRLINRYRTNLEMLAEKTANLLRNMRDCLVELENEDIPEEK